MCPTHLQGPRESLRLPCQRRIVTSPQTSRRKRDPTLRSTRPRNAEIGHATGWLVKACWSIAEASGHEGNGHRAGTGRSHSHQERAMPKPHSSPAHKTSRSKREPTLRSTWPLNHMRESVPEHCRGERARRERASRWYGLLAEPARIPVGSPNALTATTYCSHSRLLLNHSPTLPSVLYHMHATWTLTQMR